METFLQPAKAFVGDLLWKCDLAKGKTPVFIVGCQRSGTKMVLQVLDKSPQTRIYRERNRKVLDEDFRIRSEGAIRFLMCTRSRRFMVMKPLNDSQHTVRLLNFHPNAKAIWTYRGWQAVVNSASRTQKWNNKEGWKDIIVEVNSGNFTNRRQQTGIGELVSGKTRALIGRFCSEGLTAQDGAALFWYARNSVFFDLGLHSRPDVAICKYENLVSEPVPYFKRLFDFLGCPFSPEYTRLVKAASVSKHEEPANSVRPEIKSVCDEMLHRLDAVSPSSEANK